MEENCQGCTEIGFIEWCQDIRAKLEELKTSVKAMKAHSDLQTRQEPACDHGEILANIMLAYRHLEDARMRMGKAIQARDGGTSCYPK